MSDRPLASPGLEALIIEYQTLDDEINTLEETLRQKKDRRKTLGELDITNAVQEEDAHLSGVMLGDGTQYTFERQVKCGIKNEHKPAAFGWLAERNLTHMLKRHIILSFPKDSAVAARTIQSFIARILPQYQIGIKVGEAPADLVLAVSKIVQEAGMAPVVTMTEEEELPGSTLASFVKKCLAAGITLPPEFGVFAPLRPIKVVPVPTAASESATEPVAAS